MYVDVALPSSVCNVDELAEQRADAVTAMVTVETHEAGQVAAAKGESARMAIARARVVGDMIREEWQMKKRRKANSQRMIPM